ncbi:YbjQ family protein [Myxococcota bacterium]|nr:YbjQ family protein [Myxococcota bacterium]
MSSAITHQADLKNRPSDGLLLVTTPTLPGFRVLRVIGLVRGNTIRTRHVGNDIVAALRNLVGGEIPEYTKLMGESREQALDRMRAEALARGANAILGVQFTTAMVMAGAAEMLAYGTAVVVEPE